MKYQATKKGKQQPQEKKTDPLSSIAQILRKIKTDTRELKGKKSTFFFKK